MVTPCNSVKSHFSLPWKALQYTWQAARIWSEVIYRRGPSIWNSLPHHVHISFTYCRLSFALNSKPNYSALPMDSNDYMYQTSMCTSDLYKAGPISLQLHCIVTFLVLLLLVLLLLV